MANLLVLGHDSFGVSVAEAAQASGKYEKVSLLDDANPAAIGWLSSYLQHRDMYEFAYPAFEDNLTRMGWIRKLQEGGYQIGSVIHPSAVVSPSARLGEGVCILANAVVDAGAELREGVMVQIGALVECDVKLEPGVRVSVGAVALSTSRMQACEVVRAGNVVRD